MSDIPLEVAMNAERLWDDGGNESAPTIIAKAILAERERCSEIARSIEPRNEAEAHLIETIVRRMEGKE